MPLDSTLEAVMVGEVAMDVAMDLLEDMDVGEEIPRAPRCTSGLSGEQWIKEMLSGNEFQSYTMFTMKPSMFLRFRDLLVERCGLGDSNHVTATVQVTIFLHLLGHGESNRVLAERFQLSGATVSKYIHTTLYAVCSLRHDFIRLPHVDVGVHPHISQNSNFFPHFQNCIGAIDGTHIIANVKKDRSARYRNRKGWISQNVMVAVSFDLQFQYVATSWEGSAGDMKVLHWALQEGGFRVPHGKQYLVDCGYANTDYFLAPYRGIAYHLQEFQNRRSRHYRDYRELYNHRHSQLRNCVERAFGVLKMRFRFLSLRPYYDFNTQCKVVQACCVVHNFIRREYGTDEFFNSFNHFETMDAGDEEPGPGVTVGESDVRRGDVVRDTLARGIWAVHGFH